MDMAMEEMLERPRKSNPSSRRNPSSLLLHVQHFVVIQWRVLLGDPWPL